jgi:hypothetical protein
MSASAGSTNLRFAEFESQRFGEPADARAALAEFAEEADPIPLRPVAMAEVATAPAFTKAPPHTSDARVSLAAPLNPRARFVDLFRVVLIRCVCAMAVGASFGAGFKYISTDPAPQAAAVETLPLMSTSHGWLFVPYRRAVESERPVIGTIVNETVQPATPNRSKGELRWLRRTMGA